MSEKVSIPIRIAIDMDNPKHVMLLRLLTPLRPKSRGDLVRDGIIDHLLGILGDEKTSNKESFVKPKRKKNIQTTTTSNKFEKTESKHIEKVNHTIFSKDDSVTQLEDNAKKSSTENAGINALSKQVFIS